MSSIRDRRDIELKYGSYSLIIARYHSVSDKLYKISLTSIEALHQSLYYSGLLILNISDNTIINDRSYVKPWDREIGELKSFDVALPLTFTNTIRDIISELISNHPKMIADSCYSKVSKVSFKKADQEQISLENEEDKDKYGLNDDIIRKIANLFLTFESFVKVNKLEASIQTIKDTIEIICATAQKLEENIIKIAQDPNALSHEAIAQKIDSINLQISLIKQVGEDSLSCSDFNSQINNLEMELGLLLASPAGERYSLLNQEKQQNQILLGWLEAFTGHKIDHLNLAPLTEIVSSGKDVEAIGKMVMDLYPA